MCYQTICLFSLCGHTSISERPIRNVKLCQHARTIRSQSEREQAEASQTGHNKGQHPKSLSLSQKTLITPFPSPQEFETARDLYHSVPASPMVPTLTTVPPILTETMQADPQDITTAASSSSTNTTSNAHTAHITQLGHHANPHPANIPLHYTSSQSHISCLYPKFHPLHTFTVPTLCLPCHHKRLTNLARFEALAIKESIDRESFESHCSTEANRGRRTGSVNKRWSQRAVAMGENGDGSGSATAKKIVRTKDGKLFPLICVEERKIAMEQKRHVMMVEEQMEKVVREGQYDRVPTSETEVGNPDRAAGQQSIVGTIDEMDNSSALRRRRRVSPSPVPDVRSPTAQDARTTHPVQTVSNPQEKNANSSSSSASSWSWWTRKPLRSTSATDITIETISNVPAQDNILSTPAAPKSSAAGQESQDPNDSHQRPEELVSRVGNSNVEVLRDSVGRNVKGIQRILGWDGGGLGVD